MTALPTATVPLFSNLGVGVSMTTGWGETEVPMDVSSRRLAPVQHRHLPARGLLSLLSLLRAFLLTVIKRNQVLPCTPR